MNGVVRGRHFLSPVMVGQQGLAKRHFRMITEKKWLCKLCPERSPFVCCNKAASMARHITHVHASDVSPWARYNIVKPYEGRIWMPTATLKRLRDEAQAGGSHAGGAEPTGTQPESVGVVEDAAGDEPDRKRPRSFGKGVMRAHLTERRKPTPAEKKEMDRCVLRFVVENNIPFRATQSESFRDMVSMFCDYTPPHRHTLAGSHLTREVDSMRRWVQQTLADPELKSFSVALDGWCSKKNERLIGFSALIPFPVMLGCRVMREGESAVQLQKAIKSMFADDIFHFTDSAGREHDLTLKISSLVTDRASCVIRATEDFAASLREKGCALALNRCSSHAGNLLAASIERIPFFASTAKKARKLAGKLRRKTKATDFFREVNAPYKHIPVGVVTRWTSLRSVYKALIANAEKLAMFATASEGRRSPYHKTLTPQLVGIIRDSDFWRRAAVALRVTEAVCEFIELTERDAVHLVDIYAGALTLREKLKVILSTTRATWDAEDAAAPYDPDAVPHGLGENVIQAVDACVSDRWPMLVPPAVELACALDPRLVKKPPVGGQLNEVHVDKVSDLVHEWLLTMNGTTEEQKESIEGEVMTWQRRDDHPPSVRASPTEEFSESFLERAAKAGRDPVLHFWETSKFAAEKLPHLLEAARRLFCSRVSAAGLERVWSQFTNLLRGNRINCLPGTADKLIFVQWNWIQRKAVDAARKPSPASSGRGVLGMMAAPAPITSAASEHWAASAALGAGARAGGGAAGVAGAARVVSSDTESEVDAETERLLASVEARDAVLASLLQDQPSSGAGFSDSSWATEGEADDESDGEEDLVYWAREEAFDQAQRRAAGGRAAGRGEADAREEAAPGAGVPSE